MDAFKKHIDKKDLMLVLRSSIFMSITGGLIIGAVDLVFVYFSGLTFTWLFLLILAHLIAKRVSQSYQSYHICFSLISMFFFLFSYYLMNVTMMTGFFFINDALELEVIKYFLNPLPYFRFLNPFSSGFFQTENILDVVFFAVSIVYSYRFSK